MLPFTEKYKPSFSEVACCDEAKQMLKTFVLQFAKQSKRAALVFGPSGSGKTSCIYALAFNLGFELIELNASDFRNKQQIHEIIGKASQQQSLFKKGKIILIDELEGISGTKDRGGIQEVLRLLETTAWPIVLVANDAWQEKLRPLRSKSLLIEFKKQDKTKIARALAKIAAKEKINVSTDALEALASINECDIRASINDLQNLTIFNKKITKEDIIKLKEISTREKDENIFQALRLIFKSKAGTINAFDNVQNLDHDDFFLWLDENLPREYKREELAKAYDALSIADVFRGRIRRWQYWRYLVYIMALLTEGISGAKKQDLSDEFVSYKPPTRILKMWIIKQKLAKKKSISEKLAKKVHCSKKAVEKDFAIMEMIIKNNKRAHEQLKLEPEELDFLKSK